LIVVYLVVVFMIITYSAFRLTVERSGFDTFVKPDQNTLKILVSTASLLDIF